MDFTTIGFCESSGGMLSTFTRLRSGRVRVVLYRGGKGVYFHQGKKEVAKMSEANENLSADLRQWKANARKFKAQRDEAYQQGSEIAKIAAARNTEIRELKSRIERARESAKRALEVPRNLHHKFGWTYTGDDAKAVCAELNRIAGGVE